MINPNQVFAMRELARPAGRLVMGGRGQTAVKSQRVTAKKPTRGEGGHTFTGQLEEAHRRRHVREAANSAIPGLCLPGVYDGIYMTGMMDDAPEGAPDGSRYPMLGRDK